ncbi:unnamed protein product [Taenia asiatica]|uniref:Uncharacterized protein n=1 Tax=Taenia asiatica TaxID=60517 RepID=A0A0R3VUT1_TAEAS|nr:unnamed protein product [Taenia asiatica]
MSDVGRTRLNLADSEIKLRSNRAIWAFLLEHSRKAVEKQNKKEEALKKAIAEAHDRDAWLKRWLKVQKSTDMQIAIYRRLLELMEGESGLISLLRHLYDKYILPISGRLPLEGITLGDNFQANLAAASLAQENASLEWEKNRTDIRLPSLQSHSVKRDYFAAFVLDRFANPVFVATTAGDLQALSAIASQLDELARVVHSSIYWLDNKEVVAKLTQACRLCLRLVSLRTHRLQQEMAQRLGVIPS